jgi:serine O-acetyltransferase
MYPFLSKDEVWDICLRLLEKDSPIPDLGGALSDFRPVFDQVYEKVSDEHTHVKSKYYRSEDRRPIVNPLYVEHYARLVYYFSRELFLKGSDKFLLDQIFLSIKTRCCIDLFYEFDLKDFFLAQHPYGTVLGRAEYSDHLIVFQHCTIGHNKAVYPRLGRGVVLRPGSMILGNCDIGDNVHISAGTLIVDKDVPSNTLVSGQVPNLAFKENHQDNIEAFFD